MRPRLLPDNPIVFHLREDLTVRVKAIKSQMYINTAIYIINTTRQERKRDDPSMTSAVLKNHEKGLTRVMRSSLRGRKCSVTMAINFERRISRLRTAEASAIQSSEAESVASPGIDIPRLPL